ncbi:hypothetical protein ACLRGF_02960 [Mycetocola zhadangensis]|uniref:hypothetical protein n=1 Tax=Mycetocola zhadangensis TaxID=1164595 RepID=UPI003A4DB71D
MNNLPDIISTHEGSTISSFSPDTRGSLAIRLLTGILFLEAVALVCVVLVLVFDILTQPATSVSSAIALTVLVVIAAIFVSAVAVAMLRRAPWSRGAAVVWQLVQLAIAFGAFQGATAQPAWGWAILAPTLVALILLFTKSVMATLRRPDVPETD